MARECCQMSMMKKEFFYLWTEAMKGKFMALECFTPFCGLLLREVILETIYRHSARGESLPWTAFLGKYFLNPSCIQRFRHTQAYAGNHKKYFHRTLSNKNVSRNPEHSIKIEFNFFSPPGRSRYWIFQLCHSSELLKNFDLFRGARNILLELVAKEKK